MKKRLLSLLLAAGLVMTGCGQQEVVTATEVVNEVVDDTEEGPSFAWLDETKAVEERVALLLAEMTLEEKAYQMLQPEQANVSALEITKYGIGSVLSGGGSSPSRGNRPQDWNIYVNSLIDASLKSRLQIPLLYGVDAVHGHNNVYGATVFPHNIGLGAADDEELMYDIARVTAEEVRATGIQWDFSPCLGNPQDVTWGRTYECFSENTEDITRLSDDYIRGLQENGIIACAKHFIGEGYTENGVNQGDVKMSEAEFDELLASGVLDPYTGAVNAGVLTVMPSYNSINGVKCHANYHLLTEVLKEQLGFKGFVISDYNAIEQIAAANLKEQVCISVNAGVDMLMEPTAWKDCAKYIVELVNEGKITQARIDDAVSRILYVKFTAGLFNSVDKEEQEKLLEAFGSEEHREVARRAVRESMVLFKESEKALEALKNATNISVAGEAADDIGRQCGGWTISWQGMPGQITKGTTIYQAICESVAEGVNVVLNPDGIIDNTTEVVVAVFGEEPYAEYMGDRNDVVSVLEKDEAMLENLRNSLKDCNQTVSTIALVEAGRPIDLSKYEDMFDAIILVWLPGTEGEGVTDVLLGDYEFTGTLKYTWPYWLKK